MPYLIRAINRENWPEPDELTDIGDLIADALNDITTTDNKLSVWYADNQDDIYNALIAYLGTMDKWVTNDSIDYVAIDMNDIKEIGLPILEEKNTTYISGEDIRHRDIAELNYTSIENISKIIIKCINEGRDYIADTGVIKELFIKAVKENKISRDVIDKSRHKKLFNYIKDIEEKLIIIN
jgi:hypothetical protein